MVDILYIQRKRRADQNAQNLWHKVGTKKKNALESAKDDHNTNEECQSAKTKGKND
jgi:hypothetical protein